MNIRQLSKKRYKEILSKLSEFGIQTSLQKSKNIKSISFKEGDLILVEDHPSIVYVQDLYIPFIGALNKFEGYKKVYVDKGAVRYLINGADIMRPGIVYWEPFNESNIIVAYVEEYNTPLVIGKSLISSKKLDDVKKGKVILNLHHVKDRFWDIAQEIDSS